MFFFFANITFVDFTCEICILKDINGIGDNSYLSLCQFLIDSTRVRRGQIALKLETLFNGEITLSRGNKSAPE